MSATGKTFPVLMTGDFYGPDGSPKYRDMGLSVFAANPQIACKPFAEHRPEIGADQIGAAAGVIVLTPKVTAKSLANSKDLLAVGRFGVGYDTVDGPACTAADVLLFITPGAVNRPVAEATVGWMISLCHNVLIKDRLVHSANGTSGSKHMGRELRDRTLGVVGMGGIGKTVVELLRGFGMKQPLAFDPFLDEAGAQRAGVKAVSLETLLREADFVSVHCPLTDKTRNLIAAKEIAPDEAGAYLINTARGGIVVEDALFAALKERRIAGAALDCFEVEPVTKPHRFGELDNVIMAPHSIAWTDELFRDIGRAACQGMVDLSQGKKPMGVINAEVFDRKGFQEKWAAACRRELKVRVRPQSNETEVHHVPSTRR